MSDHDNSVRQEEDKIQTGRVVTIGLLAFVAFAVGIYWAVRVQTGQTGSIKSDRAPRPAFAGKPEIGMVYQPFFGEGPGIAAQRAARQQLLLHSYGFSDGGKQTAHIPIDRAIKLVIERGKL